MFQVLVHFSYSVLLCKFYPITLSFLYSELKCLSILSPARSLMHTHAFEDKRSRRAQWGSWFYVFCGCFFESRETLSSHTPYRLVNNFQPSFTEAVVREEGLEFCAFLFQSYQVSTRAWYTAITQVKRTWHQGWNVLMYQYLYCLMTVNPKRLWSSNTHRTIKWRFRLRRYQPSDEYLTFIKCTLQL